ncbi:MAG: TlpA disulfide reductase family protein [Bacteroidota bacterium]
MRIFGVVCCLLLWGSGSLSGQSVSVHSQNSEYSGKTIQVGIDRNPFISIPRYVETVPCSNEGHFEYALEVGTERVIHFETGVYRAYLYVEPGYHYEVDLPEYREKSYADRISPFYQPVEIPLRVLSRSSLSHQPDEDQSTDINLMIARFDSTFSRANSGVIMNRRLGKSSDMDSIVRTIEEAFCGDSSLFFENYRRYKYGVLKLNEGITGLESISRNYLGPTVMESHPGFLELFKAMFKDFLFYYSRTPGGKGLIHHINRTHNLDSVRYIIGQHPAVWNDTLTDMVLLQELSGLFYTGEFHKKAILILLDSMEMNPVSPDYALYTSQVKEKLSSLMTGHPPPPFALPDLEGNLFTPGDFKGKYVYLMFCTPEHYGCMMEYPFLQSFHLKHASYLEVVTVMVAKEESQIKEFMIRNGYGWKAFFYEDQPGILSDFLVRAFPTAYLIGPDGNLLLSPSSLPSDGFEQQLFRIMRSRGEI